MTASIADGSASHPDPHECRDENDGGRSQLSMSSVSIPQAAGDSDRLFALNFALGHTIIRTLFLVRHSAEPGL